MTTRIPVKAIFDGSNVTALGEFVSGDSISTVYTDAKITSVAGQTGDISNAQLQAAVSGTGVLTTANVSEVTNLYFTNARSRAAISVSGDGSYNPGTGVITINTTDLSSYATTTYVGTAISDLVAAAPSTLNTLNELAAALGNDNNFATSTAILIGAARDRANTAYLAATAGFDSGNTIALSAAAGFDKANTSYVAATAGFDKANTAYVAAVAAFDSSNTKVATVAGVTSNIVSNVQLASGVSQTGILNTSNVIEGSNLYYTIDRANTAIDNRVTKAFIDALNVDADTLDGLDSSAFALDTDLTTANVTELTNLYFTNARATSAVTNTSLSNITLSRANNTADGAGQILLNGLSGNRIDWNTEGTGAPSFTTRSVGTKLVLYPALGASAVDYAIGINSATLWYSIPGNDAGQFFKWYGGDTEITNLSGTGNFTTVGDIAVNGGDLTTTAGTFNLINTAATTLNIGGDATAVNLGATTGTTTVRNDLVVTGNVTVNGTTTTVNAVTITVDDKNLELGSVATPTDITAEGGGITLKGTTDKTINWVGATTAWTSSEDFNLLSGKVYEINGTSVLSATTLGAGVVNSSLTSVGTLGSLNVTGNIAAANVVITGTSRLGTVASGTWNGSSISTTYTDAKVASVNGQVGTVILSTANVAEVTNLYYSNARVYANVAEAGYAGIGDILALAIALG